MEIGSSLPGPDQAPTIPSEIYFPNSLSCLRKFCCSAYYGPSPISLTGHNVVCRYHLPKPAEHSSLTLWIIQAPRRAPHHSPWQLSGTCLTHAHSILIEMTPEQNNTHRVITKALHSFGTWGGSPTLSHERLEGRTGIRRQNCMVYYSCSSKWTEQQKSTPPTCQF